MGNILQVMQFLEEIKSGGFEFWLTITTGLRENLKDTFFLYMVEAL